MRVWWIGALVLLGCGSDTALSDPGGGGAPGAVAGAGGMSTSSSTSSAANGCQPVSCDQVPCGVEWPDGCGDWVFCACEPCAPSRGAAVIRDDDSIGTRAWEALTWTGASDDAYTHVPAMTAEEVSHFLVATDFGFALPPDAEITGIEVLWERGSPGAGSGIFDQAVRIVRGGVIGAEDHARPQAWADDQLEVYGGPGMLWGEAWTADDVNDPNFGAAIAARYANTAGNGSARVDWVWLTVRFASSECP